MLLMIDNYDSFTHNVARYLRLSGMSLEVVRHDQATPAQVAARQPEGIVISPGPGRPRDAGYSMEIIEKFAGKLPILGVCLGLQAIGEVFGAKVVPAARIMHGKTSLLWHSQQGLYANLPQGFPVARYHSLALQAESLPHELFVDAWTGIDEVEQPQWDHTQAEVMAIRHSDMPVFGVQYHPEAIQTAHGRAVIDAFVAELSRFRQRKLGA